MTDLPPGWEWATLAEVADPDRPLCYGILMPKAHDPDGVPYVKVRDFPNGRIDVTSLQRTSPAIADKYRRSALNAGDVLVSIRGTYGRVALAPPELAGGNVTQDTARVSPGPAVAAAYLLHFLRSDGAQRYFGKVARGVAVKGVNIGDLKQLPIPLPPLAEQERIVAAIDEPSPASTPQPLLSGAWSWRQDICCRPHERRSIVMTGRGGQFGKSPTPNSARCSHQSRGPVSEPLHTSATGTFVGEAWTYRKSLRWTSLLPSEGSSRWWLGTFSSAREVLAWAELQSGAGSSRIAATRRRSIGHASEMSFFQNSSRPT